MPAKLLQSCPTLCYPMDCSPPGSSVHEDYPGKNIGVGCHALLQGIFPTQELNWGLLHCRWILYQLSHKVNTRVGSLSLLQGIFPTQELNWGLLHCKRILSFPPELPAEPQKKHIRLKQLSWRSKSSCPTISCPDLWGLNIYAG